MSDGLSDLRALNDLMLVYDVNANIRGDPWDHDRLIWTHHVEKLVHENRFHQEYRMSLSAHTELVKILDPFLERKEYNSRQSHPIQVEHILGVGLHVVYGGTIADNRHIFGMSIAAGYRAFDDFIDALNIAPALDIKLPTTTSAWERANLGFFQEYKRNYARYMLGCGWFLPAYKQTKQERSTKPTVLLL